MAKKQIIWLSFDLGLRGDYENLYSWLDQRHAKECGDGVAMVEYKHDGESLPDQVKADLEKSVALDKRSRVYVIWRSQDRTMKGRFIAGTRRAAPWVGMAAGAESEDDEG